MQCKCFICLFFIQSKGFPVGVYRFYKRCLKARQGVSFLTHCTDGADSIIGEAIRSIPSSKLPDKPICLVKHDGEEVERGFTLLNYCLEKNISQPSRVKAENRLFLLSEEDLKGGYNKLINFYLFRMIHSRFR